MNVYLLDASVLVDFILKNPPGDHRLVKQRMARLVASQRPGAGLVLFVPNFCMAECSKTFARIFVDGSDHGASKYRAHIGLLLDTVSSKKKHLVQTYKLKRPHLVDIEDVFMADRRLPLRENEDHLSGYDGCIVAMARTLCKSYAGKGNVYLLTAERRMARVCNHNRHDFPQAVCLLDQEIPGL